MIQAGDIVKIADVIKENAFVCARAKLPRSAGGKYGVVLRRLDEEKCLIAKADGNKGPKEHIKLQTEEPTGIFIDRIEKGRGYC